MLFVRLGDGTMTAAEIASYVCDDGDDVPAWAIERICRHLADERPSVVRMLAAGDLRLHIAPASEGIFEWWADVDDAAGEEARAVYGTSSRTSYLHPDGRLEVYL